jgi:hypothetical protein
MGKTALLDYAAGQGDGCTVVRAVGVESEMELPFAALHQLCLPLLEGLERLPPPQRDALRTAFGLSSSARPDPFFVGLAVLTLLSDAAEGRPLISRRRRPVARPVVGTGAVVRGTASPGGVGDRAVRGAR